MFPNLKLYAIIAGIVFLVIAGLSTALYLSNKAIQEQAASIATLQVQVNAWKDSVNELQSDAKTTRANQDALFSQLNDVRTNAARQKDKIVIPAKVLHDQDSALIGKIINDHTRATLKDFEVLTQSGKK